MNQVTYTPISTNIVSSCLIFLREFVLRLFALQTVDYVNGLYMNGLCIWTYIYIYMNGLCKWTMDYI